MRSGGGVLCISVLQFLVGFSLLIIYETYKTHYFNSMEEEDKTAAGSVTERQLDFRTPMDFVFYIAVINNVFSIFGLAGVLHSQKELVTSFFAYNAVQVMVAFGFFIDVCVDVQIRFAGEPTGTTPYENAAAAFIFFNFLLSIGATIFAIKALDEIKAKQREDYNRLTVLSDTLNFEPDV
ncbi:hypothetical protein WJX73_009734 [Symbiochloris irregularis]|uniref:Uncharacterized protein n=1 Tax=Symbiochloris irregularis TaxID=706552 RepID=A0AAW1P0B9_9CHLO